MHDTGRIHELDLALHSTRVPWKTPLSPERLLS